MLLRLGDTSLAKSEDLEEGLKGAGDRPASLTILRAGKQLTIQVQPRVRVTMGPVQPDPPAFWIGVSVSPVEPALRSQLKLPDNRGLLAIAVVKDGAAAQAEVKVHDILLSLDGKPLDSQEKLVEVVQSSGEKSVPLELIREGKTQTVFVTPHRRKPAQPKASELDMTYQLQLLRPGAALSYDPVNSNLYFAPNGNAQGQAPVPYCRNPPAIGRPGWRRAGLETSGRARCRDQTTAQGDRRIEQGLEEQAVTGPRQPCEVSSGGAVDPGSLGGRGTTASPAFASRLRITFQWRARLWPSMVCVHKTVSRSWRPTTRASAGSAVQGPPDRVHARGTDVERAVRLHPALL